MIFLDGILHFTINDITSDESDLCNRLRDKITECISREQYFLPVVVNSGGGYLNTAIEILEIIKASPIKIFTIATGTISSAALPIFSAGVRGHRFICPNTSFMGHEARTISPREEMTKDNYDKMYQSLKMADNTLYSYLEDFTHLSKDQWEEKLSNTDFHFSCEDAVEYGVGDKIKSPVFRRVDVPQFMVDGDDLIITQSYE